MPLIVQWTLLIFGWRWQHFCSPSLSWATIFFAIHTRQWQYHVDLSSVSLLLWKKHVCSKPCIFMVLGWKNHKFSKKKHVFKKYVFWVIRRALNVKASHLWSQQIKVKSEKILDRPKNHMILDDLLFTPHNDPLVSFIMLIMDSQWFIAIANFYRDIKINLHILNH